jgi:uncharacterized protein YbjT (DUF2867 family)
MKPASQILVVGATGSQGGAVAQALLSSGVSVRALVRDLQSDKAIALAAAGASLIPGDLRDASSLEAALTDVGGVFSVQLAPSSDRESERREGRALIEAARKAGAIHFVHASVSGVAMHRADPRWLGSRWNRNYWDSKADVEDMVREAGFQAYTILRPALLMENFIAPKAAWMFPDLARGRIRTAVRPETSIPFVGVADVAAAVAAAFADQTRFGGADVLSVATGARIVAETVSPGEAVALGQQVGWVETQEWFNESGYPARPSDMAAYGLRPTPLADWALVNRKRLK